MVSHTPLLTLCYLAAALTLSARDPFLIGGESIPPGARRDFDLPVPALGPGEATFIPITVFHGPSAGPVLAITLGIHGYEFPPILAGQRLLGRINPAQLSGTLVLVRLCHVEAFRHRAVFYNPTDRRNLNRVFPGRPDGSQSERIAHVLSQEVIRRADLHLDIHSGDGAELLEAFAGIYGGQLAAQQFARSRELGLAFGFRNIVKYSVDTQEQLDRGRSCNRQAVAQGIPTVLIEIGENGRTDDAFVTPIVDGVLNVLRVFHLLPGAPRPPRADTRWFDNTTSANATRTGIFYPAVRAGQTVRRGALIGAVRDYADQLLEEIRSPADGLILYMQAGPPVNAGESAATIALPDRNH